MLKRLDRIQVAVPDAGAAAKTFGDCLGAAQVREDAIECLGARRTVLRLGESEIELLQAAGAGPVEDFLKRWGSGLFAAGFSSQDVADVHRSLEAAGAVFSTEGDQTFIEPTPVGGLRAVITPEPDSPAPDSPTSKSPGLITHIYEATNVVPDWKAASDFYTRAFGLEDSRFHPISSALWGYTGTLTLFNPPQQLDRIEITQTDGSGKAMGRFFEKRGPSLYMCFGETDDFTGLVERLEGAGARFQRGEEHRSNRVLYIHPSALHGMLMGVSVTGAAWEWSSDRSEAVTEL